MRFIISLLLVTKTMSATFHIISTLEGKKNSKPVREYLMKTYRLPKNIIFERTVKSCPEPIKGLNKIVICLEKSDLKTLAWSQQAAQALEVFWRNENEL